MPLCVVYEQWSQLITSAGLSWSHGGNRRRFYGPAMTVTLVHGVGGDEDTDTHAEDASSLFRRSTYTKKHISHQSTTPRLCERFGGVRHFDFQCPAINEVASKPPPSRTSQTAESADTRSPFTGIRKPRQAQCEDTTVTLYLHNTDMIK